MKYLTSLFIAVCIVMVVFTALAFLIWVIPMIVEWYCSLSPIVQVLTISMLVITIYVSFWVYYWLYD